MSQLNVDTITNAAGSGGQLSLTGGDFNFDSNTLFVDVSEDRVGVGTGTPSAALDVRASGGIVLASSPLMEKVNIVAGEVNATTDVNMLTAGVHQYTTAGTADWTHNLRGDASTTFNSILEIGQVAVYTCMAALGSSSGYFSSLQIDGVAQTITWNGGSAPAARGADTGWDIVSFSIFKTANATFTVLGSMSTFSS